MGIAVVSNLVPLRRHTGQQRFVAGDAVAQHKKGGLGVVLRQPVKKTAGIRAGAVVKGQGDAKGLLRGGLLLLRGGLLLLSARQGMVQKVLGRGQRLRRGGGKRAKGFGLRGRRLKEHGPCRQRALGEGELRKDTQQRHCRREHHKAQDALSLQALIEHGGLPSLFLAESAPKGTKAARFCSSISARKKACKKKGRQGGRLTPAGLAGLCGGVV